MKLSKSQKLLRWWTASFQSKLSVGRAYFDVITLLDKWLKSMCNLTVIITAIIITLVLLDLTRVTISSFVQIVFAIPGHGDPICEWSVPDEDGKPAQLVFRCLQHLLGCSHVSYANLQHKNGSTSNIKHNVVLMTPYFFCDSCEFMLSCCCIFFNCWFSWLAIWWFILLALELW